MQRRSAGSLFMPASIHPGHPPWEVPQRASAQPLGLVGPTNYPGALSTFVLLAPGQGSTLLGDDSRRQREVRSEGGDGIIGTAVDQGFENGGVIFVPVAFGVSLVRSHLPRRSIDSRSAMRSNCSRLRVRIGNSSQFSGATLKPRRSVRSTRPSDDSRLKASRSGQAPAL